MLGCIIASVLVGGVVVCVNGCELVVPIGFWGLLVVMVLILFCYCCIVGSVGGFGDFVWDSDLVGLRWYLMFGLFVLVCVLWGWASGIAWLDVQFGFVVPAFDVVGLWYV